MKIVTIHQPEYFPWLGFLHKASRADVFVLLDDVQFNRASLQQRAKIGDKPSWLSIPFVHKFPQRIDEVTIADGDWGAAHLHQVHVTYGSAPHYAEIKSRLIEYYEKFGCGEWHLDPVVKASAHLMLELFDVKTQVVTSSSLSVDGKKGERVLNICKALGGTRYLSGRAGAEYLDKKMFENAGVEIVVTDFVLPVYRDKQPDPNGDGGGLSSLDALVYLGEKAKEIIR